jgi:hypothetical protein
MLAFGNSTFVPVGCKTSRMFSVPLLTWHASKGDVVVFSHCPVANPNHRM